MQPSCINGLQLDQHSNFRSEDYSRKRRKKSRKDEKNESRSKREKRESGEIVDNESDNEKEASPAGRPHPLANKLTSILPEEIPSDGRSNL